MKNYVRTPTILQMEATECGAASLAMVLAYYGRYVPLEQMRVETAVSRNGVNAADILRAARRMGLECHGYTREIEALKKAEMPCIIHWNFDHFMVLEGFKGKKVYVNDPALGHRVLTREEFSEGFTGIVLTFKKTTAFKKEKKESNFHKLIQSRLSGQYSVVLKLIYIGLLLVIPGLIIPILSQVFIDDILIEGYKDWLTRLLVFMGCCLVVKQGLQFYRSLILSKLEKKLTLISGYRLLRHMFHLPAVFFDQRYSGDLADRMKNNQSICEFVSGNLAKSVLDIFTSIFYLFILLFYSWELTLIGLFSIIVSLFVSILANKVVINSTMKQQMFAGKLYGAVCAGLNITDTIKASGIELEYANRLMGHQAVFSSEEQKLKRFQQIVSTIPSVVNKVCSVFLLLAGAMLVINGRFTTGMLVSFTALFDSFIEPVNELVCFFENIQTLKSNMNRVNDIEHYPEESHLDSIKNEMIAQKLSGRIELKSITFGYIIQKSPTIRDISFKLKSGQTIALVGTSGCGKSTVAKVISGLYTPWSGEILLDGIPMKEIPQSIVRASIATVSQNVFLFSGTIRDNITMWNSSISDEDMIAAAKDACIHDFIIQLPGGYEYKLVENAVNLSGGQRQRLEIARALAGNPTILIMDEATSALDPVIEKEIIDNLKARNCTLIIVAHRLSTIRDCDEIAMMNNGTIIQRGTHEELKIEDGIYQRFIQDT